MSARELEPLISAISASSLVVATAAPLLAAGFGAEELQSGGSELAKPTSALARRLRSAGAVVKDHRGVVAVGEARQSPFGPTLACGSGGSGDRAAAAAAGIAEAVASGRCQCGAAADLVGEARVGAAFCGLVCLRPSPGSVPRDTADPSTEWEADLAQLPGLLGRSVADVGRLFDAAQGSAGWHRRVYVPRPAFGSTAEAVAQIFSERDAADRRASTGTALPSPRARPRFNKTKGEGLPEAAFVSSAPLPDRLLPTSIYWIEHLGVGGCALDAEAVGAAAAGTAI